jgi:dihydroneopterin aldolase
MAGDGEEEPTAVTSMGGGDKLILRGMQFHGFHGVKQEEKKLGQKFVIDVDAWMDLAPAGDSDDISHTVSYTDIYRCRALYIRPVSV